MRTFGRWQVIGFMLAVSLCATAGTSSAQTRGMGRINGVVTESDGSTGVSDVTVKTTTSAGTAIEGKTDAKGSWMLPGIGKGVWTVEFKKDGYVLLKAKVTVEQESLRSEPIKLTLKKL
jgi:redox-regulated HSP33 family molecular chaperone